MQVPVHALGMKVAEQPKQALERAAEPVDRPRGYHVDLAAEPRRALVYSVGALGWTSGAQVGIGLDTNEIGATAGLSTTLLDNQSAAFRVMLRS